MFLVTGGAGFIGSHIVEALVDSGERVRVLDNLVTGATDNLAGVLGRVEFVRADIRDQAVLRNAMRDVEVVFHVAALGSVPRSIEDPQGTNDVNVNGTLAVLTAARDAQVRRVVFSSSSSVYGANPELPKRESLQPAPVSPYAVSKLTGELYARVFNDVYGLETVSLRYFNVFGPRQRPDSQYAAVIPRFMNWALRDEPLTIYGDGAQSRDFTYVSNVVRANLLAAAAPNASGRVFNVACGTRYSLLDLVAALEAACSRKLAVKHAPPRPGDVAHSLADISAACDVLGYTVDVDFTAGLRRTWEAFRRRHAAV